MRCEVSPSQLVKHALCERQWAFRYVFGMGDKVVASRAFGLLVHAVLQNFAKREPLTHADLDRVIAARPADFALAPDTLVKMKREAVPRAIAGLQYLPNPSDCEYLHSESALPSFDWAALYPDCPDFKLSPLCRADLVYSPPLTLVDFKTTRGGSATGRKDAWYPWYYAKTPAELEVDPQVLAYAIPLMAAAGVREIGVRWIYLLSDLTSLPHSTERGTHLTWDDAVAAFRPWVQRGQRMIAVAKSEKPGTPEDFAADTTACSAFGGCPYRARCGGPCQAESVITRDFPRPEQGTKMNTDLFEILKLSHPEALAQLPPETQAKVAETAPPLQEPPAQLSLDFTQQPPTPPPTAPAKRRQRSDKSVPSQLELPPVVEAPATECHCSPPKCEGLAQQMAAIVAEFRKCGLEITYTVRAAP